MHIVYYPDPVLLNPAAPVEELPENLDEIVDGMREVMEMERGIGLAAPQVGLSTRIILVNPTGEPEDEQILINPEITRTFGTKEWAEEGCLSFPGIWGEVMRPSDIEVRYTDLEGNEHTFEAGELLARVLQHEIDHLDGKIFVNKMKEADRNKNKARLQELRDRYAARNS